jgi:riboflavin synthase alpha subunit
MMSVNDPVNIETDILAKYVEGLLKKDEAPASNGLTVKKLAEEGF